MRKLTVPLLLVLALWARSAEANLILNGGFETNTAGGTAFNLYNFEFSGLVADAIAFGDAEEIDLVTGLDFGIAPRSGDWKVGIHTQDTGGPADAFSLALSSALLPGQTYALTFFASSLTGARLGNVEIGLSGNPDSFGTFVFAGEPLGPTEWTPLGLTFIAPASASFLTVRSDPTVRDVYNFLDDFSLEKVDAPVPEPVPALLLGAGLLTLTAWGLRSTKPS